MLTTRTHDKLARIVALYTNGARASAKRKVQALTRRELADLLIDGHQVEGYCFGRQWDHEFKLWVRRALEGYDE